jgi:hypothetical protein
MTMLLLAGCSSSLSASHDGAATDGNASPAGGATFRLEAPDPTAWFAVDSGTDCQPHNWLYVLDANGLEIQTFQCCTYGRCDTCTGIVCQNAWTGDALPASKTWDGTVLPMSQCGATGTACVGGPTHAPAGHYQAKMCAYRGSDMSVAPVCVTIPFDLPASAPVVGTLPQ